MSVKSLMNSLEDPALLVFSERLNHALDLALWTQDNLKRANRLAELLKVNPKQAFEWLNGIHRPDKTTSDHIAEVLQVNAEWLLSGIGAPLTGKHPSSGLISLPQLPLAEVTNYANLLKGKTWIRERFAVMSECSNMSFVIYVENEALSPIFPRDTRFVVDPLQAPEDGDYVLVKVRNGIMCGTLVETDEGHQLLLPLNAEKHYHFKAQDKIIGTIIEAVTKFV